MFDILNIHSLLLTCSFPIFKILTFKKRTFKKRFLLVIRSFIASYQKVMNNCKKTVGKKGTMLAVFYIRCSQMIGYQVYTEGSKPWRNTLL